MPEPGWYPDPAAAPGRYRYWDGAAWSAGTGSDPAAPAPTSDKPDVPVVRRIGLPWLTLLLALALVATLAVLFTRPGTPVPGPTPTPSASYVLHSLPSDACTSGRPLDKEPHPADGRVYGGGLSYRAPKGWEQGTRDAPFEWAWDVGETEATVDRTWFAMYAVGTVSVAAGFDNPRRAAELAMGCTIASSFYPGLIRRSDVVSKATTVDGHPAWVLRSALLIDETEAVTNSVVQITVVDLGSPDWLSFFWGSAPIANRDLVAQLDRVVGTQLRAD